MSFSSNMKRTANKLLNKYADDITIIQVTLGAYTPTLGESPSTEVLMASKGFPEVFSTNEIIPDVINIGDVRMIIETDIAITKQDLIEYNSDRYDIINIEETRAQNTNIIYTLHIRK